MDKGEEVMISFQNGGKSTCRGNWGLFSLCSWVYCKKDEQKTACEKTVKV